MKVFFRPSGACSLFDHQPTVETVGYSLSPLPGLERTEHDALAALLKRIVSAKQKVFNKSEPPYVGSSFSGEP